MTKLTGTRYKAGYLIDSLYYIYIHLSTPEVQHIVGHVIEIATA